MRKLRNNEILKLPKEKNQPPPPKKKPHEVGDLTGSPNSSSLLKVSGRTLRFMLVNGVTVLLFMTPNNMFTLVFLTLTESKGIGKENKIKKENMKRE